MDYFSELLDSYNKLKKRSFKLTYLSEAEEEKAKKKEKSDGDQKAEQEAAAEKKAQGYADAATQIQDDQNTWDVLAGLPFVETLDGASTKFKIYKSKEKEGGNVVVWGPWGGLSPNRTVIEGGAYTDSWKEFVAKILGAEEGGEGPSGEAGGETIDQLDTAEKRQQDLENQIGGAEEQLLINAAAKAAGVTPRMFERDNPDVITDIKLQAKELMGATAQEAYEKALEIVDKFCLSVQNEEGAYDNAANQKVCDDPIKYIAGKNAQSLESKLARGTGVCIDRETGLKDTSERCDISPGLKGRVAESNNKLLEFLVDSDPDCENIRKYVGTAGNSLVLFDYQGGTVRAQQQGIVIKKPNSLQQAALRNVEKCAAKTEEGEPVWGYKEDVDGNTELDDRGRPISAGLGDIIDQVFSDQTKNAIKGTLFELVPSFVLRSIAIKFSKGKTQKRLITQTAEWLQRKVQRKHAELIDDLADDSPAMDIESFVKELIQNEQLSVIQKSRRLAEFLAEEAVVFKGYMDSNAKGAKAVIHLGLAPEAGGREDNAFLFDDADLAADSAESNDGTSVETTPQELLDSMPTAKPEQKEEKAAMETHFADLKLKLDQPVWTVGFGQKRKDHLGRLKGGETSTQKRLQMLTGVIPLTIKDGKYYLDGEKVRGIEFGFIKAMTDALYGEDESRQARQESYGRDTDAAIEEDCKPFTEEATYANVKNKQIKKREPGRTCDYIATNLRETIGGQDYTSTFAGLFFHSTGKKRSFAKTGGAGKETRSVIHEGAMRCARIATYKKDYTSVTYDADGNGVVTNKDGSTRPASPEQVEKQRACEDHLIRNLMATVFNRQNMPQVMQDNDRAMAVFAQNGPTGEILQAQRDGTLRITFDGLQVHFSVPETDEDGETAYTTLQQWSQERTWRTQDKVDYVETRSTGTFNPACWEGTSTVTGKPRNRYTQKPKAENAGVFYEFLKGQQSLLEKLLTPSTEHRSYQV